MKDYKDSEVKFVPEQFFVGHLVGHGSFFSRFGEDKMFRLDLYGSLEDEILMIEETATYSDGEVRKTSYRFEKLDEHHYRITSPTFVEPIVGQVYGNAFNWKYRYRHKTESGETVIKFDDWMILHDDGVLIDRAFGSIWGISVGEIVMSLQKAEKN